MAKQAYTPTPFDQMVTTEESQLLKALIPYFPTNMQRFLSLYTKMSEIEKTASLFENDLQSMQICEARTAKDPFTILSEIRPYLGENTCRQIDQMSQMLTLIQSLALMADSDMEKGGSHEPELEK